MFDAVLIPVALLFLSLLSGICIVAAQEILEKL